MATDLEQDPSNSCKYPKTTKLGIPHQHQPTATFYTITMNFLLRPNLGLVSLANYLSSESRPYQNGMFHISFFNAYFLRPQLTTNPFQSISWPFIQMLLALGKEQKLTHEQFRQTPWNSVFKTSQSQAVARSFYHTFGEQDSKLSFQLPSYLPNHHYLPPLGHWPNSSSKRSYLHHP